MKKFKHQEIRRLLLSGESVESAAEKTNSTIGYAANIKRQMIDGAKKPKTKKIAKKPRQKKHKPMGLVELTVTAQNAVQRSVTIDQPKKPWYARVFGIFGGK